MRIAITGGTGFIGGHVVRDALAAGHEVRLIARDAERARGALGDLKVELAEANLTDRDAVAQALSGREVLIHAAAGYSYARGSAGRLTRENALLTAGVLGGAEAAGVRRVVDVSSAVVFRGHPSGTAKGITDLTSPLFSSSDRAWADPYLRSKTEAESVVSDQRTRGLQIASIHPAMVIGPQDSGPGTSGATLLAIFRERLLPPAVLGWCDVRDVSAAILRAAEDSSPVRAIICAETLSLDAVGRILDRLTGEGRRRAVMPAWAIRLSARMNDRVGGRLLPALPEAGGLEYPLLPKAIDGASGQELLGRDYRPVDATFADALRWWSQNGMLDSRSLGRLAKA